MHMKQIVSYRLIRVRVVVLYIVRRFNCQKKTVNHVNCIQRRRNPIYKDQMQFQVTRTQTHRYSAK